MLPNERVVQISVDSRLRLRFDQVPEATMVETVHDLCAMCTHKNPQWFKKRAMGFFPGKDEPPEIKTFEVDESAKALSLPRGCLQGVRDVLTEHELCWSIVDDRSDPGEVAMPEFKKELWSHQPEMIDAMLEYENSLVLGETGSGKTTAVLAAIAQAKRPALVVVWNTALMQQWITRIVSEMGIPAKDIGYIRGSKRKLRPITVAMQQTLANLNDEAWMRLNGYFGFIACDEVQKFAAKTFLKVIDRSSARYRVGVSASEKRKDGKHFLIHEQFGQPRLNVDRKRLVKQGAVLDVEIRVVPTRFTADWYLHQQQAWKLERAGETAETIQRQLMQGFPSLDEDEAARVNPQPDFNRLLEAITKDADRNAMVFECVDAELREHGQGLLFSHRVQHCREMEIELAARGVKAGLMIGGKGNEPVFEQTAQGILNGSTVVGVGTYQALGTGLDFPSVEFGVATTPIHTNKPFFDQVRGRICRKGTGGTKKAARLYVLWDEHVFGDEPLEAMCRWNATVKVLWNGAWVDGKKLRKDRKYENAKNKKRGGRFVQL